jgi:hypothetical protein
MCFVVSQPINQPLPSLKLPQQKLSQSSLDKIFADTSSNLTVFPDIPDVVSISDTETFLDKKEVTCKVAITHDLTSINDSELFLNEEEVTGEIAITHESCSILKKDVEIVCASCGFKDPVLLCGKTVAESVSNVNTSVCGQDADIKSKSVNCHVNVPCLLCCSKSSLTLNSFALPVPAPHAALATTPAVVDVTRVPPLLIGNQPCVPCPLPVPPLSQMSLSIDNWEKFLKLDSDAAFLLDGVRNGFNITNADMRMSSTKCRNYRSATVASREESELQIKAEIELGRYIVTPVAPYVVSSLGAIPKVNKKVRLIHDLSRPEGGVNVHTTDTSVVYSTIDDAVRFIKPGSYIAKVDLKSAYRSVPIHSSCYAYMGLSWRFGTDTESTYFYDCRLPFGASRSCKVFQAISNSIVRILDRHNFRCISYIDDFLVIGESKLECQKALDFLLKLIPMLGLEVNWDKVSAPETSLSFLGVQIDCVRRTLALPESKLAEVRLLVEKWQKKKRFCKKDLQKMIGKLNWCARVVVGGRSFLRNLINVMTKLKAPHLFLVCHLLLRLI